MNTLAACLQIDTLRSAAQGLQDGYLAQTVMYVVHRICLSKQ